jgi:hypothetical protein
MKIFAYLIVENYDKLSTLLSLIIVSFILGIITGWFLYHFIKRDKKEKTSFKFFYGDKIHDLDDAIILLAYYHGDQNQYHASLVKFPDGKLFYIDRNDFGCAPNIKEYTLRRMIKELQDMVEYFPEKSFAALKLLK